MFCSVCANPIPDGHPFCSKCGNQSGASNKKQSRSFAAPALLIFLGLIGLAYWANTARSSGQSPAPGIMTRQYSITIDPAFTVPQLNSKSYRLVVPAGASNIRVQGHFTASGGLGNDIEVMVMNDDQFVNWSNGHETQVFYNSQKVTQGTVDAALPSAGTYYLVFNNRFGLLAPKALQDDLSVQYVR